MAEGDLTVHQAIVEIINEVGGIGKSGLNEDFGYNFRGIDATLQVLHPLFAKYGIFMAPNVLERIHQPHVSNKGTRGFQCLLHVEYAVYGPTGDSITLSTWGEAIDYSDKATNKAMTAAFKYALFQLFAICDPVEDGDRGGAGGDEEPSPMAKLIYALQESPFPLGVQFSIIVEAVGHPVTDVNQLTDEEIEKCMTALESAIADQNQLDEEAE